MEKIVEERLKTLDKVILALKNNDSATLREISDEYIQLASTEQDANHVSVAVVLYVLSKLLEREERKNTGTLVKNILKKIELLPEVLKAHDTKKFGVIMGDINQLISSFSGKYKDYVREIFEKASINKASRLYESGMSIERAARMLKVSRWDLASYAGQKKICEDCPSFNVKQRIKSIREIFG